jgi:Arc/MetJ-type ribon-helix-helix transcriptional regulator
MPVKVNFVLDDDVKADMDVLVESGRRSRVVNDALRKALLAIRRRQLTVEMDRLRGRASTVSTAEIVAALRQDRKRR